MSKKTNPNISIKKIKSNESSDLSFLLNKKGEQK